MKNNLLHLALLSFAGLIVIIAVFAFVASGSHMNNNYNLMSSMNGPNMNQMYKMYGISRGIHGPQIPNMYMANETSMAYNMNQSMSAYYGHMNAGPFNSMATMNTMGGSMNMPVSYGDMTPSASPIIIVVPVQNPQFNHSNRMNGMVNAYSRGMKMGM